MKFEGQVFKI